MAYIGNYSSVSSVTGSLLFAVSDPRVSDTRKITLTEVTDYITENISSNMSGYITQYSAPSATAFTVAITDSQNSIHLILTPTAGFATGTITLPAASNALDGQMVLVNCTQPVTTLTIGSNGATAVTGAPTTLAGNAYFTLKFDRVTQTWYRIG